MAVPATVIFSDEVMVAAATELLTLIDSGNSNAWINIRDADDVILAQISLNDPGGTIDTAGVLTLSIAGPDVSSNATGTAAYAEVDKDIGPPCVSMPIIEGLTAVPGYMVMTSVLVVSGEPVEILSAIIGQQ